MRKSKLKFSVRQIIHNKQFVEAAMGLQSLSPGLKS